MLYQIYGLVKIYEIELKFLYTCWREDSNPFKCNKDKRELEHKGKLKWVF